MHKLTSVGAALALLVLAACSDREDVGYNPGGGVSASGSEPSSMDGDASLSSANGNGSTDLAGTPQSGGLDDDELSAEPEIGTEVQSMEAPATERGREPDEDGYQEMDWDELLPADFSFDPWLDEIDLQSYNITELEDEDPEAQRLYEDLKELLADVPSDETLNGVKGRLPGFAVPIDFDGSRVYSFLLVPYFGACIHTPPPPANQMVYVEIEGGFELPSIYEPVIIEGAFEVARVVDDELGTAGYSMNADAVTLY